MHDEPRQQLCKLIAQYGRSLSEDPRRCGALLKDHCGQYKREIFVLVNALENRIAEDLIKTSAGVPESILISRLSKRLEGELGLAEIVAKWAVETWALALGVIDQPMPVVAPTRVQPTQPISQSTSSRATASSVPSDGGKLKFPKFSVGKVKIGPNQQVAVGEISVYKGAVVELAVSDDVTDFCFLETCDPNGLVTRLNLSGCKNFDEKKLIYLKNIHNLQFLDLSNCTQSFGLFGDENGWNALKSLKNLHSLNLSGNRSLDDMTLKHIGDLDNLELLNLDMSQGEYVTLGNINISDTGIGYLTKLSKLKRLNINKFKKITGPGVLSHLGNMTHLEFLNLTGCDNVSPSRLQELKQMLPNTRILP